MTHPNASRATRVLVATAAALGTTLVPAIRAGAAGEAASGAPSAGSDSQASLQVQAEELAGEIQAAGVTLGQLSEELDAAQLHNQALAGELRSVGVAMTHTQAEVATTRAQLKKQALLAYVTGGNPAPRVVPGRPGLDPSLMVSYADIVAHGQDQVVRAYRNALTAQSAEAARLAATRQAVTQSIQQLQADRAATASAAAAREAALGLVKGKLATLVAAVEVSQQQAEEAAVRRSLAEQDDLPPASTPASTTSPTPPATTPAPARTSPAPTTGRPAPPAPATTRPAPPTTRPDPATTRPAPPTTRPDPPTTRPAPPTTRPDPPTTRPDPPTVSGVLPGAAAAVHYAYAQLGKPYQWAGAGPNSFDCSGLVMMAWAAGGVYFPHLAQDQYDMTERIPLSDLEPGDLVFFGTPSDVYHVGIYIGGGDMIDAPSTGQFVSISSIYWTDLLGAGRVT